ncbi:hypothetical protein, partial [Clostridium tarantellae]|uniref:hypothetical protein n=1 Tax=Clostridium tarantellae TaxID=39493 RepID=UPI001478F11E
ILAVTLTEGVAIDLFCVIEEIVRVNNTILCIMCLISGIIYYYNNKKIEILIFTVFFLTIFINILTGNFDRIAIKSDIQATTINSILLTSITIRQILILIIIIKN